MNMLTCLFIFTLLYCQNYFLVSSNLRLKEIVRNLDILHCNCTKADLGYLVILLYTYQTRGVLVYVTAQLFRCNAQ